ncbi:MarR family winged helix-turn-helix transcriptional regulator [Pigmentiphaga sp. D-2]|uniref:MarR family winged helix-turn-helix transcriptional regulator n=1 Tax=Pigmentiphaga sp. D-2 TaxID=1002116 RepID=UPI001404AE99|nr:MarR family transcriptional regulator [Pigmentiphaga sp. D-2]
MLNDVSIGLQRTYTPSFGLNVSQWRMLAAAAQLEPTSVTELTDYSGMDKVTVSRALREMVEKKLMTRTLDENDRRRSTIELTEEGRRIYDEISPGAVEYERELLKPLSADERKVLEALVDRLLSQAAILRQASSRTFPSRRRAASSE